MNTKKIKKRAKKMPVVILTLIAAVILAALSLTGMAAFLLSLPFAIPAAAVLGIAIASGILSLAYEGELFWKNFKHAIKKLITGLPALELKLTRELLFEKLLKVEHDNQESQETNEKIPAIPPFIQDYKVLLEAHHHAQGKKRKALQKQLKQMERHLANQLFYPQKKSREYEKSLAAWLDKLNTASIKANLKKLRAWHIAAKVVALAAGVFMTIGATYLFIDAFAMIPFLAALSPTLLPAIVLPLAIIAGAAFALQIYNASTDMINHGTLKKWVTEIKNIFKGHEGYSAKKILWAIFSIIFVIVAILLSICTLGTWKTIVEKVNPLFRWMSGKALSLIFRILIPGITGLAGLFFNVQNTLESFDFLSKLKLKNPITSIRTAWAEFKKQNTFWQRCNPFRILTFILNVPTRAILFLGHIGSIGVTADQVGRIPAWATAIVGTASEFFEDLHYFVDHPHHHHHEYSLKRALKNRQDFAQGHSHSHDLPTRVLRLIFTWIVPLYTLAALWDTVFRHDKAIPFSTAFKQSLQKMYGEEMEHEHNTQQEALEKPLPLNVLHWQKTYAIQSINQYIQKRFSGTRYFDKNNVAQKKIQLNALKESIEQAESEKTLAEAIETTGRHEAIRHHRFYKTAEKSSPTTTETFLNDLRLKIAL